MTSSKLTQLLGREAGQRVQVSKPSLGQVSWRQWFPRMLPKTLGWEWAGVSFRNHGRIFSISNVSPITHKFWHLLLTTITFLVNEKTNAQMQTLIWKTQKRAGTGFSFLGTCCDCALGSQARHVPLCSNWSAWCSQDRIQDNSATTPTCSKTWTRLNSQAVVKGASRFLEVWNQGEWLKVSLQCIHCLYPRRIQDLYQQECIQTWNPTK